MSAPRSTGRPRAVSVVVVLTVRELHVARLEGESEGEASTQEERRASSPQLRAGAQASGAT